jgi:uncharacterized protein YbbC (DUF1343 family)
MMTISKKIIPFIILFFIISINQILSNEVLLGIDVLERQNFSILNGKRVGLITNQTGVNKKLELTIDIFKRAKNFKLVSVFAPEHGVKGLVGAGQLFDSFYDSTDGIMYYALYGKTSKPTKQMLSNIDVLVYDIQDIGVRSYTYISTLGLALEAAGENNVEFVVLDRPNPLGGYRIEGNVVEDEFKSFVSQFEIPYVYGLTCGELATILNEKKSIGNKTKCKLTVVKMKGWKRWMKFQDTDLVWVPTSPNVPQKETPFYLVATGVLGELLAFNIGISYTLPFEVIAQEWINADTLAKKLNDLKLKGVLFRPISFKPNYGDWKDKIMNGVQIHITDFDKVNLLEIQFYFLQVHHKLYPDKNPFEMCNANRLNMFDKVMGTDKIRKEFSKRFLVDDIKPLLDKDIKWFRELSRRYYLYN